MTSPYHPPPVLPLNIVFQDAHLIVVEKPSGLLSVPGRGPEKADCLVSRLQDGFPGALIVHRLDMETSGLMVLALNKNVHRALSQLFENRAVEKHYEARIAGVPSQDTGRIDLPLMKDWPNRPLQKVDHESGKPSITDWKLLTREGDCARVALTPLTGRTHQLRVHLNAIGHPILGDLLYGSLESRAAAPRLQLHASTLAFEHPVTGAGMMLQSPAPY